MKESVKNCFRCIKYNLMVNDWVFWLCKGDVLLKFNVFNWYLM